MIADRILDFLQRLSIEARLPKGVDVLTPYQDSGVMNLCRAFYSKYYSDNNTRTLMLGINPGRLGAGATGISFTDPLLLQQACGITNDLPKKPELSADFIYRMISAYGGPESFYKKYFISSVCPLGFTLKGNNINYYDIPRLQSAVIPFIVQSIGQLTDLGVNRERVFCIGEGKNFKFLQQLNEKHQWFKEVIALPHPRFVMQYRRKKLADYIDVYLKNLR